MSDFYRNIGSSERRIHHWSCSYVDARKAGVARPAPYWPTQREWAILEASPNRVPKPWCVRCGGRVRIKREYGESMDTL